MSAICLTVDDAPSSAFAEKLAWLRREGIAAVFFVWGERVAGHERELVEALRAGYRLENHSWSHLHFSAIGYEAGCREIERGEAAVDDLYRRAGVPRGVRRFRFPYFDRGAGEGERAAYQAFLRGRGYEPARPTDGGVDVGCDFDQAEYWLGNPAAPDGLDKADAILARIDGGRPADGDIVLIHDHDYSHGLFFECVERYRAKGLAFATL